MIFLMSFTPVIIEKNRKSIVIQDYVKAGTYLKQKKKKLPFKNKQRFQTLD